MRSPRLLVALLFCFWIATASFAAGQEPSDPANAEEAPLGEVPVRGEPAPATADATDAALPEPGTDSWRSIVVGVCGGGLFLGLLLVIILGVTFGRQLRS